MSLPVLSLLTLLGAVVAGSFLPVNVGVLSIALACLIGILLAGMKLRAVVAGFPAGLFLPLLGVTLLFSQARVNGTLDRVAAVAIRCARAAVPESSRLFSSSLRWPLLRSVPVTSRKPRFWRRLRWRPRDGRECRHS